ncbi:MAG TPA: hypothetical protein P5056_03955 [Candidatus Paceibacterota bacterium]|nr:hypothetical protein [Candidatus Paceibacterota bacterium]
MNKSDKENIIEIDGWRVYDLPVKYTKEDYDGARAEIIKEAENTPELLALFEYGYIPAPGISDMDFWAVFPDDSEKMYIFPLPILSKKTRHIMKHQIILITEENYRKMLYLDPWTMNIWPNGHSQLYKKPGITRDLNFEKIKFSKEDYEILSALNVEEHLSAIYSAIPLYAQKELPVRSVFEEIKSCIYIAREVSSITGKKIDQTFSEEFSELRSNWFNLEQEQAIRRLIKIFYKGLLNGFESAFILSEWISKNSQIKKVNDVGIKNTNILSRSYLDKNGKNVYLNTFRDRRLYSDTIKTPEQALRLSINSCKKIKINLGWRSKEVDSFIIFQPLGMSAIILGLASESGLLSNSLKKDIFTNLDEVSVLNSEVFRKKMRMINDITEKYNKKQVPQTNGKGWVAGNNRFGYSFEKEKIRRKFWTFWLKLKYWDAINENKDK